MNNMQCSTASKSRAALKKNLLYVCKVTYGTKYTGTISVGSDLFEMVMERISKDVVIHLKLNYNKYTNRGQIFLSLFFSYGGFNGNHYFNIVKYCDCMFNCFVDAK